MNPKYLRFALMIAVVFLAGCSSMPGAKRVTTPDARHTYMLSGSGAPTVILESGLGDGKESWAPVYGRIAKLTQVFAYDRAGYGFSRSSNASRDGATIVRELRSTLRQLDLKPPYVLVGHSIGGTYMELYARSYPEEIGGVVLVDSRHADFTRQCQLADAGSCTPPALLSVMMPGGPRKELADGDRTMDEVLNAGRFPAVPLVVLTGGKQFLSSTRFYDVWLDTQKSLAGLSDNSRHLVCDRCGHYVHKDNPAMVVEAVKSVIDQVRVQQNGAQQKIVRMR